MAKFKWTVEIEVDEVWVEDGFDLTDDRAHAMVCNDLAYAYGHEIRCKVIKAPDPEAIAKTQGYKSLAEKIGQAAWRKSVLKGG